MDSLSTKRLVVHVTHKMGLIGVVGDEVGRIWGRVLLGYVYVSEQ